MLTKIKKGGALLFCILLCGSSLSGCGGNNVQEAESLPQENIEQNNIEYPITIQVAEMQVAEHPITRSLVYFGEEVEKRTEGRINVDVCPAAILGTENTTISKVKNGSLDIARVSSITMSEYYPDLTPLALPYIFESREHMWNTVESPLGDKMLDYVDDCDAIAWIDNGARCFYANVPIYSPEDMKDKKFRVPNSQKMYSMLHYYGAIPVTFDLSEVYTNVENGNVAGAENDIISYDYFANSVVARYFTRNNHSFAPAMLIAGNGLKDKIGEEDYNILLECAKDAQAKSRELWDATEEQTAKRLKLDGVKIIEPTDEAMAQFRAAAQPMYDEYPQYADIIEEIKNMK